MVDFRVLHARALKKRAVNQYSGYRLQRKALAMLNEEAPGDWQGRRVIMTRARLHLEKARDLFAKARALRHAIQNDISRI